MKYKYTLTLERDGETMTFNPEVTFGQCMSPYGNGYSMQVDNCGFGPGNVFDCRYDLRLTRLLPNNMNEFFPIFARDYWDGEDGSCMLVDIKEIKIE